MRNAGTYVKEKLLQIFLLHSWRVDFWLVFLFVAHTSKKISWTFAWCLDVWCRFHLLLTKCFRWSQAPWELLVLNILPRFSPTINWDSLSLTCTLTNFPSASVQLLFEDDSSEHLNDRWFYFSPCRFHHSLEISIVCHGQIRYFLNASAIQRRSSPAVSMTVLVLVQERRERWSGGTETPVWPWEKNSQQVNTHLRHPGLGRRAEWAQASPTAQHTEPETPTGKASRVAGRQVSIMFLYWAALCRGGWAQGVGRWGKR